MFLDLLPDDPNVIVGHSLHMTCQLQSDEYDAKDLKFEFRLFTRQRRIQVPASCVYAVNASVATLNYTNMRPPFDRATVSCYHRNRPTLRAMQIIKVGRECFYLHFVPMPSWCVHVCVGVCVCVFHRQSVMRCRCKLMALKHLSQIVHLSWRFSLVVTLLVVSMKLLYIELG